MKQNVTLELSIASLIQFQHVQEHRHCCGGDTFSWPRKVAGRAVQIKVEAYSSPVQWLHIQVSHHISLLRLVRAKTRQADPAV